MAPGAQWPPVFSEPKHDPMDDKVRDEADDAVGEAIAFNFVCWGAIAFLGEDFGVEPGFEVGCCEGGREEEEKEQREGDSRRGGERHCLRVLRAILRSHKVMVLRDIRYKASAVMAQCSEIPMRRAAPLQGLLGLRDLSSRSG
ncbi:hypothetical protein GP486_006277 [Trichoglossum hirsutum]|uniref:Uncharacterized protein n=1 Tax=Trichoglossum hirsutum TaxID=265104 RepID=A0A9P8IDZ4_9PEZI|nr:hypothetical protein GP486_006277 [Trichoglossum hirsutum]